MRHLVSQSIQLQLKMAEMNTGLLKFILLAIFLLGCFLLKSENNNFHRSDSDVINPKDKEEHCQPKTRIAFAKTHKTGSSTIQVGLTWWCLNPLPYNLLRTFSFASEIPTSFCLRFQTLDPVTTSKCSLVLSEYFCRQARKAHIQHVPTVPPRHGRAIQGPQGSPCSLYFDSPFQSTLYVYFFSEV